MDKEKNPFADPDGSPKQGKGLEYMEWIKQRDRQYLASLSADERTKVIEARKRLAKKMNS
jgi:hypothetical protein